MLTALNQYQQLIEAKHAKPGRYICPICHQPVVLKKGKVKMPHFAHQSIKDCFVHTYKKETAAHLEGKYALYDLFDPKSCYMEYYLHEIEQISDCYYAQTNGPPIAFELQMTPIPAAHVAARTQGYASIGIDVIWIAKYEDLKIDSHRLKLSRFQNALIDLKRHILYAYNTQLKIFYALHITRVLNRYTYAFELEVITTGKDFIQHKTVRRLREDFRILTHLETKQHIQNCIAKRSVLEPTLSHLYQLGIPRQHIPDHLRIVLPEQIVIETHPIEWQVRLMHMIHNHTFDFSTWLNLLNLSEQSRQIMPKGQLALHILKKYQTYSNEIRAIMTEK
ncbi:competence protein CoiA [Macrococcus capreoli]|uniref:competence protein CoiA n=1 Tax=Macrococcus capreoli TaxID=2982690 RepID=UPI0021D5A645|nr:competence protein CoiA family protein [Macrococcus sp. TMW 2.2395]MCU7556430.1 competence protein CoiA family protein [Macrococcus sp. TMW 2.2395]